MKKLLLYRLLLLALFAHYTAYSTEEVPQHSRDELTYVECEFEPRVIDTLNNNLGNTIFTHPHIPLFEGTSLNWSGYAALTSLNNPESNVVSKVSGSWIVPTLTPSAHTTYCSCWIGIDGYASNTVEQIGTEQDWVNSKQRNYAWFEMYPNYSYKIVGFPVTAGDSISASVVYQGNNVFQMTIRNNTQNIYTVVPTSYTMSPSATHRSSAQWIVEAPYSNGILPLAHFNVVNFTNCKATINGRQGAINNSSWTFDKLTMVTNNNIAKATPSSLSFNGTAFQVQWSHE
jgi:hypothetical protein